MRHQNAVSGFNPTSSVLYHVIVSRIPSISDEYSKSGHIFSNSDVSAVRLRGPSTQLVSNSRPPVIPEASQTKPANSVIEICVFVDNQVQRTVTQSLRMHAGEKLACKDGQNRQQSALSRSQLRTSFPATIKGSSWSRWSIDQSMILARSEACMICLSGLPVPITFANNNER